MVRKKVVRANIKVVASTAGVSTQTVSRVVNNRPDVSPQTRRHVQNVIDELSYQPSALARSLSRRRSHTLGVVTAGLKYLGPSRTLSGIASAAKEAGYSLLLKELPHFDADNVLPIFQALISHHVEGIIWAVPEVGKNRNWINTHPNHKDIPIVYLTMKARKDISVISIDNYQGGRMAMAHLLSQGYKHIGHISGPLEWWEARQRMEAWKDALEESGLNVNNKCWAEGNWSPASGAQAAEKLFAQYPEMDSIFVANDQMALSAIQTAYQRGLHIPAEMGVVGFDNIAESAYFLPPLTTIQIDQFGVGRIAVEEIIKIIESGWQELGPVTAKPIMLTPTLMVRQSSLRPKEVRLGLLQTQHSEKEVPA